MFGSKSELKIRKLDDLAGIDNHTRSGQWKGNAYVCAYHQGAWSKNSLPVKPGDVVHFEATVKMLTPATNGKTSPYLAGPIFLDKLGKVLTYHDRQPQPTDKAAVVSGKAKAPANAASVRLGLGGAWEPDQPAADYVMSFEDASLWKD